MGEMYRYPRKGRSRITSGQSPRLDGKNVVKLVRLNRRDSDYLAAMARKASVSEAEFFRDLLHRHRRESLKEMGKGFT